MKTKLILPIVLFAICGLSYNIHAQIVNIPDANFKAALVGTSSINTNMDTEIQTSEAAAYTGTINVNTLTISDLTGIEAFTALTNLQCINNQLTGLNLSANTALTYLNCNSNQLISLNLSANTALNDLRCSSNQLTSLNLSANTVLTYLDCNSNQLTSLNIKNGNNINLTNFNSTNNPGLTCIQVDSSAYMDSNWAGGKDAGASFSEDCTPPCTPPTVNLGNDQVQCEGSQITLTADPGYITYQWEGPGGPTGGNQNTLTFTVTSGVTTGLYSVTITDTDGCTNSDNVNVDVGPYVPVITPNPGSGIICQGQLLLLDAGDGDAYTWNTGESTQTILVLASGTYTVTVTNVSCGTGSATITIIVEPLPDAGFSIDDNTICINQQTGSINTNSSDGALVWDWNFGAGAVAIPGVGPGPHTLTYSAAGAVTIQLILTNPANGCLSQFSLPVTVNTLPTVTTNNIPGSAVCAGTNVNLTLTTFGASPFTYQWASSQNIVFGTPNNATTSATINEAGDITVTATDVNGCIATDTDPVTLLPVPKAIGATFCQNTTGSIGIDATGLTVTQVTWTGGPNVPTGLLTANVNPTQTTNYNAQVIYNASACTLDVSVTANVMVAAKFAVQDTASVCDATPYTTNFDTSNFSSINWVPSSGLTCTLCANPTITVPALGFCSGYQITVTDITNGCAGVETFALCRANALNAEAGPDTVRLCYVEDQPCVNYVLDGSASSAQTLKWYSANPVIDGVASTTLPVCLQAPDKNNPPIYNFMLVGESPLCSNDTDRIIVTFYEYNQPNGGTDKTICGGDVQLTVLQGSVTNSWYTITPGAVIKNQSNPLGPLVTPSLSQNPSLFVFQSTNGFGCTATDTVRVTIGGSLTPFLIASPGTTVCFGDSVKLTANGGTNYQFFEDNNPLTPSSSNSTYSFIAETTHSYKVIATAEGCAPETSFIVTINVNPLPIITLIGLDTASCATCNDGAITIAGECGPNCNYFWSNGENVQNLVNIIPGFYEVTVTDNVTTCYATKQFEIPFTTGNNTIKNASRFNIYPNPFGDKLYLTFSAPLTNDVSFSLADVTGKIIIAKNIALHENQLFYEISLVNCPTGIYFYDLKTDDGIIKRGMLNKSE